MTNLLRALGVTLVLGGLAHTAGVVHLYIVQGVPDANRVMLDVWIAEVHLLGGGLYLAAWWGHRRGSAWRGLATFGALTVAGFAVPILPVLLSRAPVLFRIPAIVYLLLSLVILAGVARSTPGSAQSGSSFNK